MIMYETLRPYAPVPTSKIVDGNLPQSLVIGNKTVVLPPKTMIVPSYSSLQTEPKYLGIGVTTLLNGDPHDSSA